MIFRHGRGPRKWWPIQRRNKDGARYLLWPITVRLAPPPMRRQLAMHGWQVGYESVPVDKTSHGCVPGNRAVYGQTVTFGPVQIVLGPRGERLT